MHATYVLIFLWQFAIVHPYTPPSKLRNAADSILDRRALLSSSGMVAPFIFSSINSANAAISSPFGSLATKLASRDPSLLKNSVFNVPPSAQKYPQFLHGEWTVTLSFRGYTFPSKSIRKDELIKSYDLPGFRKCSIASIADVGQEKTTYRMKIDKNTGYEDRSSTLLQSINAHLGYNAVQSVMYDQSSNPNRLSIDFIPNQTRNANRIELFCNGRESELVQQQANNDNEGQKVERIFVCSEYIRQVTFGLGMDFGAARQVVGNYAHFWTWREPSLGVSGEVISKGNVLTAVYLDPQDPLFFQEPSKPVAVYSHDIIAKKIT